MADLTLTEDVLSLTELREKLTEKIDALAAGTRCLVVTRKGRAAAVILSPEEFDRLQYGSWVRANVARGLTGKTTSHKLVMAAARKRARGRKRED